MASVKKFSKKKVAARKTRKKTPLFALILVIFCTFLTSAGQLLLKMGVGRWKFDLIALLGNWPLLLGIILYGLGAILMIIALKYGELSIIYPFIALSFVWVMLLSIHFLGETVSFWNWLGVVSILFGVSFIGKGGSVTA